MNAPPRNRDPGRPDLRHHVLLVGIDAYEKAAPLYGSVNDVDALEALFLDRLGVPPDSITKLVAPHAHASRSPRVPEDKPTSRNLRAALLRLASDEVRPLDRVFVHFSGHGTMVFPPGSRVAREALVPVDALAGGDLLFDHELNDLLRRIAARTHDLTVVLDCCCSAGATRSGVPSSERAVRFYPIEDNVALAPTTRSFGDNPETGLLLSLDPADPGFLVAASAQSSDAAHEGLSARGVRHGAFTAALLDLLARETNERLRSLRWVDLWQTLRARVTVAFPGQHPCLIGRNERRVFGGPFEPQDPGFPLSEADGHYRVHAGTLVGLGPGAVVAVYGTTPPFFPPLHSVEDHAARLGLLRVERATPSFAVASPIGSPFPLREGARARLVKPGRADTLVVGLDPFDADLAHWLAAEAPFLVVPAVETGAREIDVLVGRSSNGHVWIGDFVFGPEAPLAWVPAGDRQALVRGLLHYARYGLPLRLARRSRDLPGALRMRVLDAREVSRLNAEEFSDPPLPEVEPDPERRHRYQLVDGQPVCLSVQNRSSWPLYTHLINCSASGRVELLGPMQLEIAPGRRQAFWLSGHVGRAFHCRISQGRTSNVERLVAVGTTSPEVDLLSLQVKESFVETIRAASREMVPDEREPLELWTATTVDVKIVRGA